MAYLVKSQIIGIESVRRIYLWGSTASHYLYLPRPAEDPLPLGATDADFFCHRDDDIEV